MSPLLQLILGAKVALVVVFGGLFIILVSVLRSARKARDLEEQSNRLLFLALEGKADQARIQARTAGKALSPLLEALAGELTPPSPRPLLRDLLNVAALYLAPVVLLVHGLAAVHRRDGTEKSAAAAALLLGTALLLPAATFAAAMLMQFSRSSARTLRAHCVSVIARSVKNTIEQDASESLRRGGAKDPRGE